MKRFFLVLILLLSFISPKTDENSMHRKNPFFSGSLSWYYPGLGQLYNGKILKSGLFFSIELATSYIAINMVSDLSLKMEEGIIVNPHSTEITRNQRNWAIGLATFTALLHIYNIYDAINDSIKLNLTEGKQLKEEHVNSIFPALSSFIMPGSGQMFNGKFKKGSELIFYQLLFKLWKIYIDYDFRNRYDPDINAINWHDLNDNDQITLLSYYTMHLLFRFYSAYDAYTINEKKLQLSLVQNSRKNSLLAFGIRF